MGMIQINMELPNSCSECRFETEAGYCKAMESGFCGNTTEEGRPEWCPLKEQEPVKPTWWQGKAYCGKCGQKMPRKRDGIERRYCSFCGRAVKWND